MENYAPERKRKTPFSAALIVRELLTDPLTTQTTISIFPITYQYIPLAIPLHLN
jgi:hypothetical protein